MRRTASSITSIGTLPPFTASSERLPIEVRERHLDVETGEGGGDGAARGEEPVGLHEAVEAPLALENVVQQVAVLTGVDAVHLVVGAHDRADAGVDGALEVRQVDLAQRALVDGDVHAHAGVLDAVQGEVLGAGDHVLLRAADEAGGHGADVDRVLAVGLLRAPPARVAQQVDGRGEQHVVALGAGLGADRLADLSFEIGIEGRAARTADREAWSPCRC